jgi:hypothetical protein
LTPYWAEYAWLGGDRAEAGVLIELEGERIAAVNQSPPIRPDGATILRGLVLPGLANAHSHAFHRALRGRSLVSFNTSNVIIRIQRLSELCFAADLPVRLNLSAKILQTASNAFLSQQISRRFYGQPLLWPASSFL